MRAGSLEARVSEVLLKCGRCYRSDLVLYARMLCSGSGTYAAGLIRRMEREGLIRRGRVDKPPGARGSEGEGYDTCALTAKGRNGLLDAAYLMDAEKYRRLLAYGDTPAKAFATAKQSVLRLRLSDVRIRLMFAACGIPVFPDEKPSLLHLVRTLDSGTPYINKEEPYRDEAGTADCRKMLEGGLFYTIGEVRAFLDADSPGSSDVTLASRARGVFISHRSCMVIYAAKRGENRIIRVSPSAEERLLNRLKAVLKITDVKRPLVGTDRFNDVWGLIISDGDALVYSTVTGRPGGIEKGKPDLPEGFLSHQRPSGVKWLNGKDCLFPRLFIVPATMSGIGSLDYIAHHDAESWMRDARALTAGHPDYRSAEGDPLYPAEYRGAPVIFLPAFEAAELWRIRESDKPVHIITYRDMADAVSRSVQREVSCSDAETMERIPPDEVLIYDRSGHPAGRHILQEHIKSKGLYASPEQYRSLPQKAGQDGTVFWNALARGDVRPEEVMAHMELSERTDQRPVSVRRASVGLSFGTEFAGRLKQAARYRDTSVTNYIRRRIYWDVMADSEAYRDRIRENRGWQPRVPEEDTGMPEPVPDRKSDT